jgi:hypothetical protein
LSNQEFEYHGIEEEEEIMPELVAACSEEQVWELSKRFMATKTHMPTR